jgi:hypothetical protein
MIFNVATLTRTPAVQSTSYKPGKPLLEGWATRNLACSPVDFFPCVQSVLRLRPANARVGGRHSKFTGVNLGGSEIYSMSGNINPVSMNYEIVISKLDREQAWTNLLRHRPEVS